MFGRSKRVAKGPTLRACVSRCGRGTWWGRNDRRTPGCLNHAGRGGGASRGGAAVAGRGILQNRPCRHLTSVSPGKIPFFNMAPPFNSLSLDVDDLINQRRRRSRSWMDHDLYPAMGFTGNFFN